jgi:AcrR family transcriptional regulator
VTRRAEIVNAALALADERGLDAVSMRGVADRVGVTPMALYPYVGNKAALLDAMIGALVGQLAPGGTVPPGTGPGETEPGGAASAGAGTDAGGPGPAERLIAFARSARAMVIRHPWAATLLFSRPAVAPDSVRTVDVVYTALLELGVPPADVPRMERMVSTVVLGYAASEAGGRFGPGEFDPRGRRGQLPEGDLPAHSALAEILDRPVDWDAEFEANLADLRLMIEAVARRSQR